MKSIKNKFLLGLIAAFAMAICAAILCVTPTAAKADGFTPSGNVCVESGASVRISEEKESGLRYQAYVNKAWFDELTDAKAGAIIVPESYVTKATEGGVDFSLQGLLNVVAEYELPFQAVDSQSLVSYNEDYYTYALTLTNVQEANYARSFVGIAYVRTTSTVDGAETFSGNANLTDGNYVVAYDANNARSVYQVAYNALTSDDTFTADQQAVLESYADGVAVVSNTSGDVTISNDVTGKYASPYSIVENNGEYLIISDENAKSVIYNGQRQTTLPIVDGDTTIHLTKTNGATLNYDGSYTLTSTTIGNGNPGSIKPVNASYIALNGSYAIGTYVEFEFKGNNMPYLLFFADEVNGNMSWADVGVEQATYDGMIVMNGLVADTLENGKTFTNGVKAFGPHRYDYGSTSPCIVNKSGTDDGGMSMDDLAATPDTEYRLVIGTYEGSGNVRLDMYLIKKYDNSIVGHLDVGTGKATSLFNAGHIVAYAPFKGGESSTFKFNGVGALSNFDVSGALKVNGMVTRGATLNVDGSITLESMEKSNGLSGTVANGNTGTVRLYENNYVAWEGNYGTETYLEFEFKGNNMPQLCFFADNINGWISKGTSTSSAATNKGFMILNGINTSGVNGFTNGLKGWSNYRYSNNGDTTIIINKTYNTGNISDGDEGKLSQDYLATTPDTTYRLVIGTTYNSSNDRVYLSVFLFDKSTNVKIFGSDISTGKGLEFFGGNPSGHIIAMAGIKGGESTTFKVTKGPSARSEFDLVGA